MLARNKLKRFITSSKSPTACVQGLCGEHAGPLFAFQNHPDQDPFVPMPAFQNLRLCTAPLSSGLGDFGVTQTALSQQRHTCTSEMRSNVHGVS
jgi:hypothetical protein